MIKVPQFSSSFSILSVVGETFKTVVVLTRLRAEWKKRKERFMSRNTCGTNTKNGTSKTHENLC